MTTIQKKAAIGQVNPIAHLTAEDIEQIAQELDDIRQSVIDTRGESDARYIRRVIRTQRSLELGSRVVLLAIAVPAGVGRRHRRPARSPRSWRTWRSATTSSTASGTGCATRRSTRRPGSGTPRRRPRSGSTRHNELHHNFTNVIGKDNDLGYGIMRVDEDQPWLPMHLGQPLWNFVNALFFEYGIAAYDVELRGAIARGKTKDPKFRASSRPCWRRSSRQVTKDYVVHPTLSMVTGSFLTDRDSRTSPPTPCATSGRTR